MSLTRLMVIFPGLALAGALSVSACTTGTPTQGAAAPQGSSEASASADLEDILTTRSALDEAFLAPVPPPQAAAPEEPDDSTSRGLGGASARPAPKPKPDPAKAAQLRTEATKDREQAKKNRSDAAQLDKPIADLGKQLDAKKKEVLSLQGQVNSAAADAAKFRQTAATLDASPATKFDPNPTLSQTASQLRVAASSAEGLRSAVAAQLTPDAAKKLDEAMKSSGINLQSLASEVRSAADRIDGIRNSPSPAKAMRDEASNFRAKASQWQQQRNTIYNNSQSDRDVLRQINDVIDRKRAEIRYWEKERDRHQANYNSLWAVDPRRVSEAAGYDQAVVAIGLANGEIVTNQLLAIVPYVRVAIAEYAMQILDGVVGQANSYASGLDNMAATVEQGAGNRTQADNLRKQASDADKRANDASKSADAKAKELVQIQGQQTPLVTKRQKLLTEALDLENSAKSLETEATCWATSGDCLPQPKRYGPPTTHA